MGYTMIRWNFDPLESLNTYFNLHKLGAISFEYERDIYGIGETGLHCGLYTDRLIAEWPLESRRVIESLEHKKDSVILKTAIDTGKWTEDIGYVEIPVNIRAIKKTSIDSARTWRNRTRDQIETAIEQISKALKQR